MGQGASDPNFGFLGQKSGAATHTLSTAQMPAHGHAFALNIQHGDGEISGWEALTSGMTAGGRLRYAAATAATGGGAAHNNVQPSITMTPLIKV